jgi:hypothetical protein
MVGLLVGQEPAERAYHRRGRGRMVRGGEIADEIVEPGRPVGQLAGQVGALINARSGWRCQHEEHSPSRASRRSSLQLRQIRGGAFAGPGREHQPHQPVSARMTPGLPHRGHGLLPAAAAARRRQSRHNVTSGDRTRCPHCRQRRAHSTHRPSSSTSRSLKQSRHGSRAACSRIRRMHLQQN